MFSIRRIIVRNICITEKFPKEVFINVLGLPTIRKQLKNNNKMIFYDHHYLKTTLSCLTWSICIWICYRKLSRPPIFSSLSYLCFPISVYFFFWFRYCKYLIAYYKNLCQNVHLAFKFEIVISTLAQQSWEYFHYTLKTIPTFQGLSKTNPSLLLDFRIIHYFSSKSLDPAHHLCFI